MTTQQRKIDSGFDANSTVDDVLDGVDLHGRTILLTGGYSGIGLAATRSLIRAGAHVIVPARRLDVAQEALGETTAEVAKLDLADLGDVRGFVSSFLASGRTIDAIIANAGVMACPERRVGPGWESQFAINHLGHFALIEGLRPSLRAGSRVVSLSSSGHFLSGIRWDDLDFRTGYDKWLAYGQAKTATSLFAVHLDAVADGVSAFAVHPGAILTPLQRHIPRDQQIERGWIDSAGHAADGFKSIEQGAATMVWAATSPQLDGLGGLYLQDCDVAEPAAGDDMAVGGVKPWAIDRDDAARLWDVSEQLIRG